ANIRRGIDFALDRASAGGWGPWYGAAAAGIGNREGIGGVSTRRERPGGPVNMEPGLGGLGIAGGMGGNTGVTLNSVPEGVQKLANAGRLPDMPEMAGGDISNAFPAAPKAVSPFEAFQHGGFEN